MWPKVELRRVAQMKAGFCRCERHQALCSDGRPGPGVECFVSCMRGTPAPCMQIGNTPMVISTDMMLEMVPRWDKIGRDLHDDPVASETMGWIRDMYAIALAMANNPTGPDMLVDTCIMAQPPAQSMVIDTKVVRIQPVQLCTILYRCVVHRVHP